MPQKKENLPVKVDVDLQNGGTITYANEVIATIAGVAANEVDGIAGMCVSGGFSEILGRNRNITRGVKVEVGSQEAAVDLYIIVEYGKPIQKVAGEVQENVRKALESLTGLHVVRVDVHVQGVSFEKEKKATQTGIEAANNPVLAAPEESGKADPAPETEAPAADAAAKEAEETVQEAPAAEESVQEAPAAEEAIEEIGDAVTEFSEEVLEEEGRLEGAEEEVKTQAEDTQEAAEPALEAASEAAAEKKPARPRRPGGRKRA